MKAGQGYNSKNTDKTEFFDLGTFEIVLIWRVISCGLSSPDDKVIIAPLLLIVFIYILPIREETKLRESCYEFNHIGTATT